MNVYKINEIENIIAPNPYVGRGIVIGLTKDKKKAAIAYFIMGRSENSRNRVFREDGDDIYIFPYDIQKVEDPSLIIYAPVRVIDHATIVTNGDQTDTVYDYLADGARFSEALEIREFEPDAPNFTPRISGVVNIEEGNFSYEMSILKSNSPEGEDCNRFHFSYAPVAGLGHFLHTYMADGNPLPTFTGEPERVRIPDDIDEFTNTVWNALNEENKISLYVRYIDLKTEKYDSRLINKYE